MTSSVIVYQYRTDSVREEYSIGIRFRQTYRKRGSIMERRNETVIKLAQSALMAALCYVAFAYLKINIPMPGGDATALHIGNAFCVLGALILGGWYGGLAGAVGMTIADLMDPVYITGAPKTFVLKLCIGLIVGLVAHRIAKINESTDRKYVLRWSVIASVAGLGFNVIADPIVGYFYKMYILGQPQEMAEVLAKWSTASTFVNAVVSTILVGVLYKEDWGAEDRRGGSPERKQRAGTAAVERTAVQEESGGTEAFGFLLFFSFVPVCLQTGRRVLYTR